ncbi:MAG: vitamin K epoxide reductase family protein [Candidatus Amulumruptor caecigallinarius]|nr:vitamin K epoxide reductase family protein [Candidatus Amulumruptor caecigallinarius]MCM1397498.1 vitamin K epoxide reductase family protein [Candidatus Amulumruptor caecigallinarius]MCM1454400.1 vitamin K epoxide reductase family protein [bacterium]
MASPTLFTDFLTVLSVPHTAAYSDMRFRAYPSKLTLTAMQDLLAEYGVLSRIEKAPEGTDPSTVSAPFVASTTDGFMIVRSVGSEGVECRVKGGTDKRMPLTQFEKIWRGEYLTASPMKSATEPDYALHVRKCWVNSLLRLGMAVLGAFFVVVLFIANRLYESWSATVALVLLGAGVYVTHLLLLKESHVESSAADRLCGVIQKEGCATVLASDGSSFMGVLPWAEVGFTYFTVSFLCLLLFPAQCLPLLAGISVLCLPYTVWSVSYQHFKAHAWCTMCLTVQSLFWLLFITYLVGGDFHGLFPLQWWPLCLMVAAYGLMLCSVHTIIPRLYHTDRAEHAASTAASTSDPVR